MSKKDFLIRAGATVGFFVGLGLLFSHKTLATTAPALMECDSSSAVSSTYQESDWDLSFIRTQDYNVPRRYPSINQFMDLNGDGLADYVYAYTENNDDDYSNGSYHYHGCVFLNNGHGFEQVHACDATVTNGSHGLSESFNGDCAG